MNTFPLAIDEDAGSAELKARYEQRYEEYRRLGETLKEMLAGALREAGIPVVALYFRVKSFDSFREKVARKHYDDPFGQTEDLCGVRVICQYKSDMARIGEIIRSRLVVHELSDKSQLLGEAEFGYTSEHYVVQDPGSPPGEGIGPRAEIQVRTLLMHAWAEVEHNLAYKNEREVPSQFRRTLRVLAAKIEEIDDQFEQLRQDVEGYRAELSHPAPGETGFDPRLELNLDTFRALLQFYFPAASDDRLSESRLFDRIIREGITLEDLVGYALYMRSVLPRLDEEIVRLGYEPGWTRAALLRNAIALHDDGFARQMGYAFDPPGTLIDVVLSKVRPPRPGS